MKKYLIKFTILLMVIIAFILAFVFGRKMLYAIIKIEPIDLYLIKENSDEEFVTNKGSYQWKKYGNRVIADSIGATEIQYGRTLSVKQNEKIYFTDDNWEKGNAFIILVNEKEDVARLPIKCDVKENYLIVPNIEGEHILQIDLTSKNGDVWYSAKLSITK